jgi:diacylglycerol kinase (ATP)
MAQFDPDYDPRHNPHKIHRGLKRVIMAAGHSLDGLRYAIKEESAFRQELLLGLLMAPWAFIVEFDRVERLLLLGSIVLVLIMELLNSGIEAAIDRISFQHHSLSKRAKDYGSAAVLLALIFCGATWITLLLPHLF